MAVFEITAIRSRKELLWLSEEWALRPWLMDVRASSRQDINQRNFNLNLRIKQRRILIENFYPRARTPFDKLCWFEAFNQRKGKKSLIKREAKFHYKQRNIVLSRSEVLMIRAVNYCESHQHSDPALRNDDDDEHFAKRIKSIAVILAAY